MPFNMFNNVTSKVAGFAIAAVVPLAAIVTTPSDAEAFSFTRIYSFGDSLSDTGNSFAATGGLLPPNLLYPSNGRFSNGPVWTEYLAPQLGASLQTLAFGGARTDATNNFPPLPGLTQQVNSIRTAEADALYVIWAGGNDYLNAQRRDPVPVVTNLSNAVSALANVGARNIAVGNLPDLGAIPGTSGNPAIASGLTQLTQAHNFLLAQNLSAIQQTRPGLNLYTLDFNSLFRDVIANPGTYGFTNVTDSCLFTGCTTPSTYLFWDEIHPTTAGHSRLADFAFTSLQAQAVPEPPATIGLILGGAFLLGMGALRKQRQTPIALNIPAKAPQKSHSGDF
ncbi:MAG: SGNH/GDSL hydrolase family protein [Leptolyngbyaceae cyanobacterium bins.349]|nr:SGNH/GDSL hydrolase family protein [Leptolyngbyaceae cyanobacterium bins.349]